MDQQIQELYKRWGAEDSTLKPIVAGWDETESELLKHGIDINYFVDLVEQSEQGNQGSKSFGEHVLHKLNKAVTVILGEHEYREFRMTSVLSDLMQIDEYAKSTSNENRSFIGLNRRERQG
ncbi:hypothetical protein HZB78_01720 [Candidatus Collierbacteria bacterium]|nr:hypothetical protein [Candidatus Collierbacteria bacterium]